MSWPPTDTAPAEGVTMPQTMLMRVVLPAPFGPSRAKISPRRMSRLTRLSASKPEAYVFERFETEMIGGIRAAHSNSCRADVDLVGVEGEQILDDEHVVERCFVAPHRVLRPALQREVRGVALEGAMRLVAGALQPVHLHVLAREVVNRRIASLLEDDGIAAVGNPLALERHANGPAGGCGLDMRCRLAFHFCSFICPSFSHGCALEPGDVDDLPGQAVLVLQPAAHRFLAAGRGMSGARFLHRRHRFAHLLWADVALVGRDRPVMAERVLDLADRKSV